MRVNRFVALFTFTVMLMASLGCNRDPNIKKQRYLESGNRYFNKGKYREAIIQFRNAVQVDPNFAAAHFRLGESYLRAQIWPDAYRELQRAVELDPDNLKAQLDLAGILIGSKSSDAAQDIINKILIKNPNNADAHVLLADLDQELEKRDLATAEMKKAIGLDPRRPEFYTQLGAMQAALGQLTDAESNLKKALEIDPKFTGAMSALAVLYEGQGRWQETELQLRQAMKLKPKDVELRRSLARLYYTQQRKADSEQVAVQAKRDLGDTPEGYRFLAEYFFAIGDSDKAVTEFESISRQHPQDLKTKEDYIQLLMAKKRLDEAGKLNDEILKKSPRDSGAQLIRGRILILDGKYTEAILVLGAVLKYEPENAYAHYYLGVALDGANDFDRAEQQWREAARLSPQINDAQFALAQVALRKGDIDLLDKASTQLVNNDPHNPDVYVLRASVEAAHKQNATAEADLQKAIEIAPNKANSYASLGTWKLSQDKLEEAQGLFEQALDRDPDQLAGMSGLIAVFTKRKQPGKAIERVKAQIAKSPNNDAFYNLLGEAQANNKQYTDAEFSFQRAIELNKRNISAFVLLENVEVALGSTDKAITVARVLMENHPSNVEGYLLSGELEEGRGNWESAQELYRKALEVKPNYPPAENNLAYLMLEHGGNTDVALSLAQAARQAMPKSPMAADTLAWAYYRKGIYGMALDLLQEAINSAPQSALLNYHLGMVYRKTNNPAKARLHFERSLKTNPKSPHAEEIRELLGQAG